MKLYNYKLRSVWRVCADSPAILGERFLRTLDLIAEAAPEIGAWQIVDLHHVGHERPPVLLPIEEARQVIARLVEYNVAASQGYPESDDGYRLLGVNSPAVTPTSISLSASLGGRFGDRIEFQVGHLMMPPDPDIVLTWTR